MTYAIETQSLTKRYGKARGIENVTMAVEQGEIFGFIGPNGAGKSTTIRTLLGLIRKTSGEARIFGLDCEKDKTRILEQVGYLPSEVFYYDNMRARDLLKYAASFYSDPDACMQRATELASRLDLDMNRKIEDMSLGNKKKVGIVQGLLHSPRLIVLDEPTSGLDPLMQRTFFDLIKEENQHGATVLFSSHILSEVQRTCDRVAIIKEGRLISTQSIAELSRSAVKRVEVTLAIKAQASEIIRALSLPGIKDLNGTNNQASFLFEGDCNALIAALNTLNLANIDISEPSLEETFMHYYTDDANAASNCGTASMNCARSTRSRTTPYDDTPYRGAHAAPISPATEGGTANTPTSSSVASASETE